MGNLLCRKDRGNILRRKKKQEPSTSNELTKSTIASNDVVIFSKTYCPFCKATKKLFSDMNIDAMVIEMDKVENGDAIQGELMITTGQRTVPNVFIKGAHLGGNDNVQAAAKSGKLKEMLDQGDNQCGQ
mmetsp:Transcript_26557/g.50366  ORF Transcript_26557/g.50366 Transcript_26557/m.50366 type:complete len:129 (+) Transcript_26557:320-706(+)